MATTAVTAQEKRVAELNVISRKQRSLWGDAFYRLIRNRAALVGLFVIAFAALTAIFADLNVLGIHIRLAPYDPLEQHGKDGLLEPVWTQASAVSSPIPRTSLGRTRSDATTSAG